MKAAIWWIRRDLRLADNQALASALASAETVLPAFVLDPKLLDSSSVGDTRVAFLLGGLRHLDQELRARGSSLILRRGDPGQELHALMLATGAEAVFAEEDFTPYAVQRDGDVARRLPLHLVGSPVVHPPGTVLKGDGAPYVIFSPFSRAWAALTPPRASDLIAAPRILAGPPAVETVPIPDRPSLPQTVPFPPGEGEARRRLKAFCQATDPPIYRYGEGRDRLDLHGTSELSPYMHLGMVSARQAVVAALEAIAAAPDSKATEGAQTWLSELIWREFYVHVLYHFPYVRRASFRTDFRAISWENDEGQFDAWREGRTGYPVVDAAMRQLLETGWIHNRARMIVASFLVKDLLIDWRWGERHFGRQLVDGDVAANNGGWQWTAGTGPGAAPYFRVFNPVLQGRRYDPQGEFVRRWIPELGRVPVRYIHQPWMMPSAAQEKAGCTVGQDYPSPIVDHSWARERALLAYARAKEQG